MRAARHQARGLPMNLIMTDEYQPAECKFQLSRRTHYSVWEVSEEPGKVTWVSRFLD
jgi:hypothetical protein